MIQTARLALVVPEARHWQPLRAMLSSPDVMAMLVRDPTVQSAEASLRRHEQYRTQHGLGFWAVEAGGEVAGFCGLKPGAENTPIAGELEIGWIFARRFWGQGLVSEAARACLDWAWAERAEPRVVAITSANHADSRRVMERIGMRHLPDLDFEHPNCALEDPMRCSVVHAIERSSRAG